MTDETTEATRAPVAASTPAVNPLQAKVDLLTAQNAALQAQVTAVNAQLEALQRSHATRVQAMVAEHNVMVGAILPALKPLSTAT
jgi:uncharacterized protein YlxW (UPF0749 family)